MTKPVELEFLFIPFFHSVKKWSLAAVNASHSSLCLVSITPASCPRRKYKKNREAEKKKSSSGNWPSSKGSDLRIWYCRLKRTPSWGRTLISTQSTSPQRSCATFVTQMMEVSLSLSFSTFSHFVIVFITFCFQQHTISTSASSTFIF